jgi:hypothetical protein
MPVRVTRPPDARNNRPTDPDWYRGLASGWQRKRMDNFVELMAGLPVEDLIDDEATRMARRVAAAARGGPGAAADFAAMQAVDFEKMEEIRQRVTEIVGDPGRAKSLQCTRTGMRQLVTADELLIYSIDRFSHALLGHGAAYHQQA